MLQIVRLVVCMERTFADTAVESVSIEQHEEGRDRCVVL